MPKKPEKKQALKEPMVVRWKTTPDAHDYPAAANYLSLICPHDEAVALSDALKDAPIVMFKAKDILRAARLDLLGMDNPHVKLDLRKVAMGVELAPVLLIRGQLSAGVPAQIADGYHRVCASYHLDENTDIPGRVIDLP